MKKNQKGFSAVEVILLVVVLGLIAGVGYYVFSQRSGKVVDNASTSSSSSDQKADTTVEDKSADSDAQSWVLLTSGKGGFSIRIPDGWEISNYKGEDNVQSNSLTYKKGTPAKVTNQPFPYGGDSSFRFSVTKFDNTENFKFINGDEQKTEFNIGSQKGTRYYKKYPVEPVEGIGPYPGEEIYIYEFKTASTTTYISYGIYNHNQYSDSIGIKESDQNQVELIERAVKTLKIKD